MITLDEERRQEPHELKREDEAALPLQARRAVRAAAAVESGVVDLEHATRRYGIEASLIEAWQHALKAAPRGGADTGHRIQSAS